MKTNIALFLLIGALLVPTTCLARVESPTLSTLIKCADCIVLALVENVSSSSPNMFVGTAKVIEVWKESDGNLGKTVTFKASPSFACDLSSATAGLHTILFLEHDNKQQAMKIAYAGRGQMLINNINGESCASLVGVVLPKELEVFDKLDPHEPGRGILPVNILKEYIIQFLKDHKHYSSHK